MTGDSSTRIAVHDNKKTKIRIETDPRLLLVLLAFCEKNIVRYAILAVSMIPFFGVVSDFILPSLYIILIILSIRNNPKIGVSELAIPLFVILAIIGTCIVYPVNGKYIFDQNNFWNTIFPCLRWFIVGLTIIPNEKTMNLLGVASCLAIIIETAFLVLYMIPNNLVASDDMSRAYQILPNIMVAICYAFRKKKIAIWLISCLGAIYLLSLGTRGPFLILTVFVAVMIIRINLNKKRKLLLTGGIISVGIFMSIPDLYIGFLKFIGNIISKIGLSTRVIEHLIDGTVISYTAGRDNLYEIGLKMIKDRPFLGYGVYGEWSKVGWSIHNMYLEFLIHYGVVIGSILLIWMTVLVCRAFFKSNNYYSKDLILAFSCFVFLRGVFGGSYLMFGVFFLLGICIKELRRTEVGGIGTQV